MSLLTPAMEALVAEFARLPGIGRKTALRLALHSLGHREEAAALAGALKRLAEECRFCKDCGNLSEEELCAVCSNPRRDAGLICVVESLPDLLAVERSGDYRGLYHILGGALSPLDGIGPRDLRIAELERRVAGGTVRELLLATNGTVEGDATALYLVERLRGADIAISRLARGVPMGGSLDFIDRLTLSRAIDGREKLQGPEG